MLLNTLRDFTLIRHLDASADQFVNNSIPSWHVFKIIFRFCFGSEMSA